MTSLEYLSLLRVRSDSIYQIISASFISLKLFFFFSVEILCVLGHFLDTSDFVAIIKEILSLTTYSNGLPRWR